MFTCAGIHLFYLSNFNVTEGGVRLIDNIVEAVYRPSRNM